MATQITINFEGGKTLWQRIQLTGITIGMVYYLFTSYYLLAYK